ncbi:MAG: Txe/YoeB family addiction module toxin [Muribaculaceae bacterium]|nr:Txe/YoeB family addiction module toxin [Muribaculaceae bacterium]
MKYQVDFTEKALQHIALWKKSGQRKILKKILLLIEELQDHPTTGTGQVEQLRYDFAGFWSRRIDKANRMVYKIEEDRVVVTVISLKGHY